MNAVLPDDLSHYTRNVKPGSARELASGSTEDASSNADWDGHSGLEMDPGTEMRWIGPEPLQ